MKVQAALRGGENRTDIRTKALVEAFLRHHQGVEIISRADHADADLLIQTGFAPSRALMSQIESQKPYIIMEAPFWRDFYDVYEASSWGYNGLAGGAWAPDAPTALRPAPDLQPMKEDDGTILIVGQKPTDHSLRGEDHVRWLLETRNSLPQADFRPHPLMVPPDTLEPICEVLPRYSKVVTFTSTVGAEALVEGCHVRADHRCNLAFGVDEASRPEWHHLLSWRQSTHSGLHEIVPYILGGYEEARALAESGTYEIPRGRIDGKAICERYYRAGL